MSQIENSRICRIAASSSGSKQLSSDSHIDRTTDSNSSFLNSPIRSQLYRFQTSSEKRLNYVLQSRRASNDRFSNQALTKNRPFFKFSPNLYQSENEKILKQELDRSVIFNDSPQTVEQLEATISNVKLEDCIVSDNNNCAKAQSDADKLYVLREVETVQCKGGQESFGTEATVETRAVTVYNANTTQTNEIATLQIQAASKQDQNLKPILKRKGFLECLMPSTSSTTLPPPILKKRDSFNETISNDSQSNVNNLLNG